MATIFRAANTAGHAGYRAGTTASESRIDSDIERCEKLISHAAAIGVCVTRDDVGIVRRIRCIRTTGSLTPDLESQFYLAMSRIVRDVPFPNRDVAHDLDVCAEVVSYAVQNGKHVDKGVLDAIGRARSAHSQLIWSPEVEVAFYDAMARVSRAVEPVVTETVGSEARKGARLAIRNYSAAAVVVTIAVMALSCLLFTIKQISDDISNTIEKNDPVAVSMHNKLQAYSMAIARANMTATPETLAEMQNSPIAVDIKEELQKFATNNRQLYADVTRVRGISHFVLRIPNAIGRAIVGKKAWGEDWGSLNNRYTPSCDETPASGRFLHIVAKDEQKPTVDWQCNIDTIRHALEIDLPLFALGKTADQRDYIPDDAVNQGFQKIAVYQDIRAMATYARDIILSLAGSTTGFLLPILYACLGACADILRKLRAETAASLFHPEHSKVANRSHMTTAVIVGISIGLFSGLVNGGTEISPLAIAFVAGYASDKFFEFIDRLVQTLFPNDNKGPGGGAGPSALRPRMDAPKKDLFGSGVFNAKGKTFATRK